jgi:hypothetical protein
MLLQGAAADIKIVLQAGSDALNWRRGGIGGGFLLGSRRLDRFILNLQNRGGFPPTSGISDSPCGI